LRPIAAAWATWEIIPATRIAPIACRIEPRKKEPKATSMPITSEPPGE